MSSAMPIDVQFVVIAKEPRPGRVKTRLSPPCTPTQAALIASSSLADTFAAVSGTASLLGAPADNYSYVYPALIGLPLTLGNLDTGVAVVQALGALLMSSTALLVYLWGRGPLGKWWAVAHWCW